MPSELTVAIVTNLNWEHRIQPKKEIDKKNETEQIDDNIIRWKMIKLNTWNWIQEIERIAVLQRYDAENPVVFMPNARVHMVACV